MAGEGGKQADLAVGGVDDVFFRQNVLPHVGDDFQKGQRFLPMRRQFDGDDVFQPVERHAFDINFVQKGSQRVRQIQRFLRAQRLIPPLNQFRQQQTAAQRRDRVGRIGGDRQSQRSLSFGLFNGGKGKQARQHQRFPAALTQKSLLHGSTCAARRQKQNRARQFRGIGNVLLQQLCRQRVGERLNGRNGEDVLCRHDHRSFKRLCAKASASGVPT